MSDDINKLLDQQAIEQLLFRYCRGIDRLDQALVRSCYHSDASDEHGSFSGTVDEFLIWCWRLLARYQMSMHYLSNIQIEVDGNRAQSESYGISIHRGDPAIPELNLKIGFRYIDVLEKRNGEWKILRRVATTEWVEQQTLETIRPFDERFHSGKRDKNDIIYQNWRI